MPYSAFVTKLSFDEAVDYPKIEFQLVKPIDDEAELGVILKAIPEAEQIALRPFNVDNYTPPAEKPASNSRSKMS